MPAREATIHRASIGPYRASDALVLASADAPNKTPARRARHSLSGRARPGALYAGARARRFARVRVRHSIASANVDKFFGTTRGASFAVGARIGRAAELPCGVRAIFARFAGVAGACSTTGRRTSPGRASERASCAQARVAAILGRNAGSVRIGDALNHAPPPSGVATATTRHRDPCAVCGAVAAVGLAIAAANGRVDAVATLGHVHTRASLVAGSTGRRSGVFTVLSLATGSSREPTAGLNAHSCASHSCPSLHGRPAANARARAPRPGGATGRTAVDRRGHRRTAAAERREHQGDRQPPSRVPPGMRCP